jgi:hypothetical protein
VRRSARRAALAVSALLALALVLAVLVLLGLVPGLSGRYRSATPALAAAYRAKETCSCLFVEGRDEEYCRAWTVATPDLARAVVDRGARRVRARALLLWTAEARFVDPRRGCVLVE